MNAFRVLEQTGFADVADGAFYADVVAWAVDWGISNGIDGTTFAPNLYCTRGRAVTFLWRAAGELEPASIGSFSDVPADAFYAKAVAWAAEKKIADGIGDNRFDPDGIVTRAQFVNFLYRWSVSSGDDVSVGEDTNILGCGVAFDIPEYAIPALQWACGAGVMEGGGVNLRANEPCTRGQVVTSIFRHFKTK